MESQLKLSRLLAIILQEHWPALELAAPTPHAWQTVYAEAHRHGLAPTLYALLRHAGYLDRLPAAVAAALHKESAYTAAANMLRLRALEQLLDALGRQGITPILLKGISLLHTVYAQPNLRPMVDMDILVLPEELRPALDCLEAIGYRPVYREQFPDAYQVVTHHVALRHADSQHAYLELHHTWLDVPQQMQRASMREVKARAETVAVGQAGQAALVLSVEDQVLQSAAHIASHSPSTMRWLWFYDLLLLIRSKQDAFDWEVLLARAEAYRLVLPLQSVLPPLQTQLKAPVPAPVLARLAALPVTREEARRFGPDSLAEKSRLVDGLHRLRGASWPQRARFAWYMLFPQRAYMETNLFRVLTIVNQQLKVEPAATGS